MVTGSTGPGSAYYAGEMSLAEANQIASEYEADVRRKIDALRNRKQS
jgi:hypothetical protein